MSGEQRKTWTSRIGFVLASAGAAVGLGAIWKFPYMAGTNGGSAFLFPYILMTFTVGAALLIAEVALGRAGRGGIVTAYRNLAGRAWVPAGYLGVLTGFLVLCFYSAIGGWTLAYFAEAATARASSATRPSSASTSAASSPIRSRRSASSGSSCFSTASS